MSLSTVVVLGMNITGLGVLQSLGERGVSLLGIDRCGTEIGFYSRYGKKVVCQDGELIDCLVELGKKSEKKRIILPTSDEYLLLVSRAEKILRQFYYLPFPGNTLLEQILDKYKFYLLASQFSDDIPRCMLLDENSCHNWRQFPAIVKPVFIHEFRKFYSNKKAWVVHNREELVARCNELDRIKVQAIVQEIIPSKDFEQYSVCVYFDKRSNVKKGMVAQKIRQNPPGYGVGTYVVMVENDALIRRASQLLKKMKYTGIAEIEYRRDVRDGKLKLIEINARVWTQNKLAAYGGADIVGTAFSDILEVDTVSLPVRSNRWIFFPRDLITCFQYMQKGELRFGDIMATYGRFWKNTGAVWSRHDIGPSLFMPMYLYRKVFAKKYEMSCDVNTNS